MHLCVGTTSEQILELTESGSWLGKCYSAPFSVKPPPSQLRAAPCPNCPYKQGQWYLESNEYSRILSDAAADDTTDSLKHPLRECISRYSKSSLRTLTGTDIAINLAIHNDTQRTSNQMNRPSRSMLPRIRSWRLYTVSDTMIGTASISATGRIYNA